MLIQLFLQLQIVSYLFMFASCFLQSDKMTIVERHLSADKKIEVSIQRVESSDVKYINLVTKTENKTLKTQTPIYFEKDWDGDLAPEFEKIFTTRQWVNEKTFFIGFNNNFSNSKDFILIINSSNKIIDQIVLNVDGTYVIYNIELNQEIKIPISWVKRNYPFKPCRTDLEVDFSDGTKILPGSNDFQFKSNSSQKQCENGEITINEKDVRFKVLE